MNTIQIKKGDLVTIPLQPNNAASNVFQVARKLDGESVLNHPLFPDCYIIKNDDELNQAAASMKNHTEKCLEYASKYKKYLDYETSIDLESLCLYFTINRKLSPKQKKALSNICGKIATIYCADDISFALRTVNENIALLDEFNNMWYSNFEKIFKGQKTIGTKNQRITVFNMAGFVLAQLESSRDETL